MWGWCWPLFVQVLSCLFISHLHCGNERRSPVGTSYLLGASVHLLLNIPTLPSDYTPLILSPLQPNCGALLLLQLGVSFHLQCSTWCQRRMAAEHRNGPQVPISLHGLYQSQMLPCISLGKTRSCRSTLSHSSKEGPVPTGPEQTMVQMMVTVGNPGVIYEGSSFPLWIAISPANERIVASESQNIGASLLITFQFGKEVYFTCSWFFDPACIWCTNDNCIELHKHPETLVWSFGEFSSNEFIWIVTT